MNRVSMMISDPQLKALKQACRQAWVDMAHEHPEVEQFRIQDQLDIILDRMASGSYNYLLTKSEVAVWHGLSQTTKNKIATSVL